MLRSLDHPLYVHTLFSITSDQKSLIKSIFVDKNCLDKPGWSGPTTDHPTFLAKILLSKPGWSDPTSDHPNLEISGWSGPSPDHPDPAPKTSLVMSGWSDLTSDHPALTVSVYIGRPRGALTLSFFFHRRNPFSPQKAPRGDLDFGPRICWALLLLWFSTSRKIRTPPELLRFAQESQRYFIQNPLAPISQCRKF